MNNQKFYDDRLESVKANLLGKYIHPSRNGFEVRAYHRVQKPLNDLEFRISTKKTIPYKKYRVLSVSHWHNKQYSVELDITDYLDCELKQASPKYDVFDNKLYQRFILMDDLGEVLAPLMDTEHITRNLPIAKSEMSESILAYYEIRKRLPSLNWNETNLCFEPQQSGCGKIAFWQDTWIKNFIASNHTFPDADVFYKINGQKIDKIYFCNFSRNLFDEIEKRKETDFGYFNTLLLAYCQNNPKAKKRILEHFDLDIDFLFSMF